METLFPVEMSLPVRLHTQEYKMNDLGVISNYIKLGTGFDRERNASVIRKRIKKVTQPLHSPHTHTYTHIHTHIHTHTHTYTPRHDDLIRILLTF